MKEFLIFCIFSILFVLIRAILSVAWSWETLKCQCLNVSRGWLLDLVWEWIRIFMSLINCASSHVNNWTRYCGFKITCQRKGRRFGIFWNSISILPPDEMLMVAFILNWHRYKRLHSAFKTLIWFVKRKAEKKQFDD